MSFNNIILLLTAIATALIAGLFYSWCVAVAPGLGKMADREYIGAMQSLNATIQNALFFASFVGALALLPLNAVLQGRENFSLRFWLSVAAAALYILGVFVITATGNVPLNNDLAAFRLDGANMEDVRQQRAFFEEPWNQLNIMRTFSAIGSLVLILLACIIGEEAATKNS